MDAPYWITWSKPAGRTQLTVHPQPVPDSGPARDLLCTACQRAYAAAARAGLAAVQALAQHCVTQHE